MSPTVKASSRQASARRLDVDQPLLAGRHRVAAGVEDAHLDPRPRRAHRARVLQPLPGRDAGGAALAGAVQLVNLGAEGRQPLDHAPLHRHRAGGGGVHDQAQAREVEAGPLLLGHLEYADEVGWNHERPRDPVARDQVQPQPGVPLRHDHGGRPHEQGGVGPPARPGVVGGPAQEVDVVGRPRPERHLALHAGADRLTRVAGVHHALGPGGRARGVEDEGGPGPGVEGEPGRRIRQRLLVAVADDERAAAGNLARGHRHLGARVLDDVGELVRLQVPVHGQEGRPQLGRRHRDLEELEAVGKDRHHRAARHRAHALEHGRQAAGAVVDLTEGQRPVAEHQGGFVAHRQKVA